MCFGHRRGLLLSLMYITVDMLQNETIYYVLTYCRLKIPSVHRQVTALGMPWPVVTTKWFICLFAEVLPVEVSITCVSHSTKILKHKSIPCKQGKVTSTSVQILTSGQLMSTSITK